MSSATEKSFYDLSHPDNKGNPFLFSSLRNKVVLIVNTASACGFTPQYQPLESLNQKFSTTHPGQFVILGFPSNQFLHQEPGTDSQIASFCQLNYGVTFPVLGKSDVNGGNENEVFTWLKGRRAGVLGLRRVVWNFEKFLVGKNGEVVGRWGSLVRPEGLEEAILKELEKGLEENGAEGSVANGNGESAKENGLENERANAKKPTSSTETRVKKTGGRRPFALGGWLSILSLLLILLLAVCFS